MATLAIIHPLPILHPKDGPAHPVMVAHPPTVVHPQETTGKATMVPAQATHHHQVHLRVRPHLHLQHRRVLTHMLILKPLSIDWSVAGANIPAVTFIAQAGLPARELAHMLDSLVRVSRRVEKNHLVIVLVSGKSTSQPKPPKQVCGSPDSFRGTAHCNQTRGNQYTNEFYQTHSLARGQTSMSLEFSSIVNWR